MNLEMARSSLVSKGNTCLEGRCMTHLPLSFLKIIWQRVLLWHHCPVTTVFGIPIQRKLMTSTSQEVFKLTANLNFLIVPGTHSNLKSRASQFGSTRAKRVSRGVNINTSTTCQLRKCQVNYIKCQLGRLRFCLNLLGLVRAIKFGKHGTRELQVLPIFPSNPSLCSWTGWWRLNRISFSWFKYDDHDVGNCCHSVRELHLLLYCSSRLSMCLLPTLVELSSFWYSAHPLINHFYLFFWF